MQTSRTPVLNSYRLPHLATNFPPVSSNFNWCLYPYYSSCKFAINFCWLEDLWEFLGDKANDKVIWRYVFRADTEPTYFVFKSVKVDKRSSSDLWFITLITHKSDFSGHYASLPTIWSDQMKQKHASFVKRLITDAVTEAKLGFGAMWKQYYIFNLWEDWLHILFYIHSYYTLYNSLRAILGLSVP